MTTIHAFTIDNTLAATQLPIIAENNVNSVRLHVDFDSTWDGYGKSAVFFTDKDPTPLEKVLDVNNICIIPPEVLTESRRLYITVKGVMGAAEKSSTELKCKIHAGAPTVIISDPTNDVYSQLLTAYGTTNLALAVERARIDNFAKLKEGSTTGDAELLDMRIDFTGKTHNTAGDATRAQALRIANETTNFEKTITDFLTYGKNTNCGWQIGEVATVDGGEVENNARVRSNFLYAPKGTHFIFNGDLSALAGMFVFVYNADKNYITHSGAYVLEYLASEDCYIRVVTKYNNEREITTVGAFDNLVEMYFPETIRKIKSTAMNEWYIGALTTENGGTTNESANKRAKSRFIYLAKNDRITFDSGATNFTGMFVFVYDTDKNFVTHTNSYVYEYTASENCYVRLVSKYKDEREITYIGAFDNCVTIEYDRAAKSYAIGDFAKYFECGEFEGMTDTLPATKIDYIYGRYDALMAAHPEYITKKLLGYATAANGGQDTAYPIYEYEIKADISERPIEDVPTILIQSGIHGDEKSSVYGTLVFFEHMFTSADNVLADIRSGFNFKTIPILNPYGYSSNVRTNARGVDINRNFGYLWDENTSAQKGASPYSELETQILRDWVAENKTALMYIDYHNMGDYNPFISYINTPCEEIQKVYSNFIRRTTNKWRERYHPDRAASVFGWINNDKIPCTYNEAYYNAGIHFSCTLEIAWDENGVKFTKRVIETSFEQLVNFIASMLDFIQRGNSEKGKKGENGYTPQKNVDYFDGKDGITPVAGVDYLGKEETKAYIATELAKRGQLKPEFAQSEEWLAENGDETKLYVLPDGMIWAKMETVIEGGLEPDFTNLMDNPNAYIRKGERYSQSGGGFTTNGATNDCAIVIPIPSTAGAFTIRARVATKSGASYTNSAYFGTNNQTFDGSNDTANVNYTDDNNGTVTFVQKVYNGGYNYIVFHVANNIDEDNLIVTLNEEITYTPREDEIVQKWVSTGHAFVPADYEDRIIEAETKLTEHEDRLDVLERTAVTGLSLEHNSCSIFRKVVCCGDSFTAGYIGTNNDNISQTNWDYAWPSFMARLTGNEYVNCGHSGKDVLTWQTSAKGLPRAQAAGKAQAYLIGLGLNDASLVTLGTASDIGTENQTYYGGLSKIIRELNAISPTAKIFVQTIPSDYVVYMNYSQAIRDVVNAYKSSYPVHLLDLYEYRSMYKTSKLTGDAIMGHYTAIGYQQFAENLRYVWSDYINQHISEFQDVYLIPYDETPNDLNA